MNHPPASAQDDTRRAAGPRPLYADDTVTAAWSRLRADIKCKVQPPSAPGGRFTKDAFTIDLTARTVTCPAGQTVPLSPLGDGSIARFGVACATCPLAAQCTAAKAGRTIHVGPYQDAASSHRDYKTFIYGKASWTELVATSDTRYDHPRD